MNETNKKNQEIQQQNEKLWHDYDELVGRYTDSAYTKATKAIDAWYQETVTAAVKAGTATTEFWEVITKQYVELWRQAGLDVATINKTEQTETREGLQATADAAKRNLDYALTQVGHWSDETIQKYRDTYEKAQRAVDDYGQHHIEALDKVAAKTDAATAKTQQLTGSIQSATAASMQLADLMTRCSRKAPTARLGSRMAERRQARPRPTAGSSTAPSVAFSTRDAGSVAAATPSRGRAQARSFCTGGSIVPNGAGASSNTFNIVVFEKQHRSACGQHIT